MNKKRAIIPHPLDPSLALVPLTRGMFAVISAVDARIVGRHNWFAASGGDGLWYARRHVRVPRNTDIHLHRVIAESSGLLLRGVIDHVNGNGLDCRRSNLRDATATDNARNARTRKDSSTGIKGVFTTASGKFVAKIRFGGRLIRVGTFETIETASTAIKAERERLHGAFANHGQVH